MALYDLVFEGGGAKGTAFVGAMEVLTAAGHVHRRLVGTLRRSHHRNPHRRRLFFSRVVTRLH